MDAVEQVYESAKADIGTRHVAHLGVVTAAHFQSFAYAVGDENPLYLDRAAAAAAGHPDVIAPPIFLTAVVGWSPGPSERLLRPDGAEEAEVGDVHLDGLRLMGAGQELEFHSDIVPGLDITMEVTVEDITLKRGASGTLMFISLLRRYHDAAERLLVTCRETFIAR